MEKTGHPSRFSSLTRRPIVKYSGFFWLENADTCTRNASLAAFRNPSLMWCLPLLLSVYLQLITSRHLPRHFTAVSWRPDATLTRHESDFVLRGSGNENRQYGGYNLCLRGSPLKKNEITTHTKRKKNHYLIIVIRNAGRDNNVISAVRDSYDQCIRPLRFWRLRWRR